MLLAYITQPAAIARSQAKKQSMLSSLPSNGLLRCARNDVEGCGACLWPTIRGGLSSSSRTDAPRKCAPRWLFSMTLLLLSRKINHGLRQELTEAALQHFILPRFAMTSGS